MSTAVLELDTLGTPELRWGPPNLDTLEVQHQINQLEAEFGADVLENLDLHFDISDISPIGKLSELVSSPGSKKFSELKKRFGKILGGIGLSAGSFLLISSATEGEVFAEGNNPPGIPADWVECNGGPGSKSAPVIDENGNQRDVYFCAPSTNTTQATTTTTQVPAPVTTQKPAPTNPPVVVQPTVAVTSPAATQAPTTSSEAPVSVTTTTAMEDDGTTTTEEKATTTTKDVTTTIEKENPTTTTTSEANIADDGDDRDSSNGIPGWVIPVSAGAAVALAFGAKFYLGRDREEHSSDDFGGTGIVAGH